MYICIKFQRYIFVQLQAIEKFSANTSQIGVSLRDLCTTLQETEFPNTVEATEQLILDHQRAEAEVVYVS